ncbi:hypothetical protein BS17DRAFT_783318 [Gyrodon lividus]|nr:hypothetical protein BS17DRAFT_783318 [Gyrodon lividus]
MSSNQPLIQSTNPLGEDGVVRCQHEEEAAKRTSRTANNPNREFYCCNRQSNDPSRCKFFYWANDPMFRRKEINPSQPQTVNSSTPAPSQRARAVAAGDTATPRTSPQKQGSAAVPETPSKRKRLEDIQAGLAEINGAIPPPRVSTQLSTPRPSQLPEAGSSRGLDTPQSSPQKKPSSSPSILETLSKRKRLEDIEAGLRSAESLKTSQPRRAQLEVIEAGLRARNAAQTLVRAGPSFNAQTATPGPSSSTPSHLRTQEASSSFPAYPPSPASTEIDWDKELPHAAPTHGRYSFLGLPSNQDPTPSMIEPATPKNRRLSLLDASANATCANNSGRPNSLLLTPPQTTQHRTVAALPYSYESNRNSRPDVSTLTRRKGKECASPQWDGIIEGDEENPFNETTSAFRPRAQSQSQSQGSNALTRPARAPRDSEGSPTTTDQIAVNIVGMNEPIRSLKAYIDSLEQLDAVKHIEKLDREKRTLTLGHEAKRKRIAALSAELNAVREQLRQSEENCRVKDTIIATLRARPPS